jgi:hypothetical protein
MNHSGSLPSDRLEWEGETNLTPDRPRSPPRPSIRFMGDKQAQKEQGVPVQGSPRMIT